MQRKSLKSRFENGSLRQLGRLEYLKPIFGENAQMEKIRKVKKLFEFQLCVYPTLVFSESYSYIAFFFFEKSH